MLYTLGKDSTAFFTQKTWVNVKIVRVNVKFLKKKSQECVCNTVIFLHSSQYRVGQKLVSLHFKSIIFFKIMDLLRFDPNFNITHES